MAIKWKSKVAMILWILLLTYGINALFVGLTKAEYYLKQDYFQTPSFKSTLEDFINDLLLFELLDGITEEKAKEQITVTNEEINEHRYRYGNLNEQIASIKARYEGEIEAAKDSNNEEVVNVLIAERDALIADITANFTSDDHVRSKIVKEKEQAIEEFFQKLEDRKQYFTTYKDSFKYYLKQKDTGKVYTNIAEKDQPIEQYVTSKNVAFIKNYSHLTARSASFYNNVDNEQVQKLLKKNTVAFEGQIAIPKTNIQSNTILEEYYDFKQRQIFYYIYCLGGIAALIISFFLYKSKAVSFATLTNEKIESYYNQIPMDIRIIAFLITIFAACHILEQDWFFDYWETVYSMIERVFIHLLSGSFVVALILIQGKFLLERYKDRSNARKDWQQAALIKIKDVFVRAFLNRRVGTQVVIILFLVFCFGFGATLGLLEPAFLIIYALAVMIIALPMFMFIMKRVGYFNQIVSHTNELVHGNLEADLPIKGKSVLAKLAENISTLKYGVKVSQKEKVKSERLKTELITNVSHDLRTPLTSIITYIDLLKSPELTEDERKSYIEIIDRKAKRLKVLIDDLFEASKMASGNIELVKERIDLTQLLDQALAEYDEKMKESTLQWKISKLDTPVYAMVDGQKIWRVFDNIIGNILKYSLDHTRVYITMKKLSNQVEISFKNISKYELGGDVDELFERFKRGDTSRQTEGSGLGLAIAKSIVDLHGGEMEIDVDGDLFKVIVRFYVKS